MHGLLIKSGRLSISNSSPSETSLNDIKQIENIETHKDKENEAEE